MGNLVKTPQSEVNATLETLDRFGVTPDHLARLRAEPDYAKRIAEFMLRGGLEGSVHHKLARALMGKNFFGVEEWATLFNVQFTKKQLRQVAEFPCGEDILNSTCPLCGKSVKECHFAFVGLDRLNGYPLTILTWQELYPATGQPKFYSYVPQAWYSEQKFAKETTMKFRWYLLHQNILPGSENRTFDDQMKMLTADYEMPSAIAEVTKDLFVFKKAGNYVNLSRYARTACVSSFGGHVGVGLFVGGWLSVNCWSDSPVSAFGVAASRKFPS